MHVEPLILKSCEVTCGAFLLSEGHRGQEKQPLCINTLVHWRNSARSWDRNRKHKACALKPAQKQHISKRCLEFDGLSPSMDTLSAKRHFVLFIRFCVNIRVSHIKTGQISLYLFTDIVYIDIFVKQSNCWSRSFWPIS